VEHLLFVGLVPRKADTKGLISMRFSAVSDPSDVSRARSIIIGALTGVNAAIVLMLDYVMLTSAFGYAPRYAIPVTALLMLITYVWYERRMRAVKIELEKRVAITPKNN
ncbi:MAG: hypothetical protein HGA54_06105, partial [Actinobacteria bacterium]|nr:hypothetical protein [Actinomycetota bacterium]